MSSDPIYLDYNGTTPIAPEVADAMLPYLREHFGNPSSSHVYGRRAKEAVETAREQLAALINCEPGEIHFTSGGTESNNQVLFGTIEALGAAGGRIVTSRVEHPAITEPCLALLERGFDVRFVPVDRQGMVDLAEVEAALSPDTLLISVMHSNNEVGTLQPIEAIAALANPRGIALHTDAAQSVGKVEVNVKRLGVDFLSVAGHKLYAPKGIGALYVRAGRKLGRLMYGAGQEREMRPGTENVPHIVGLGAAAALARERLDRDVRHVAGMRNRLQENLTRELPDAVVHGHPTERLPNTLSIGFPGLAADRLLETMSGVAASAGAACHSDQVKVSHVLDAMGVPLEVAMGTLRFTVGRYTTPEEIEAASTVIVDGVRSLKTDSRSR